MATYDVHVYVKLSIPVDAEDERQAEQKVLHDDPDILGRHLMDGNFEVDVQHVEKVID